MDRGLLAPRWLALHAVVLVALLGCGWLGAWQLDRAREQRDQSARPAAHAERAAVALDTVLPPGASMRLDDVGRRVEVRGTYDAAAQLVVPDRDLDGTVGSLVLVPLVTQDGSAVVVVRGWTEYSSVADLPAPPTGPVVVSGWLGPSESAPGSDVMPDGQVGSVHLPTLVNLMPYELRDAFVAMSAEEPPPPAGGVELTGLPAPLRIEGGGLPLQNVFYAIEWWTFGLAAVALWVSAVRRRGQPITTIRVPADPYTGRS